MGFEHNVMAHQASVLLLQQIRTASAPWSHARLTPNTTLWQGMAEWPRPDIAFEDRTTTASFAIEFKPPNQPKREYVTGIGQALIYLNDFEFAGLIVPERSDDGFEIGKYVERTLEDLMVSVPLALFTYRKSPSQLVHIRKLQERTTPPGIPVGIGRKVFWGYWRDLSNFDLLSLLEIGINYRRPTFNLIYKRFWKERAVAGRALTWEARKRKPKKRDAPSFESEQLNARLAMLHAGLLTKGGGLTSDGLMLLQIGKIYGADSIAFKERLAWQVLVRGRHLELIFWIEEKQRALSKSKMKTASTYYKAMDAILAREGIITSPPKGGAKPSFLRDEPKLWNKLDLLIQLSPGRYFHPRRGLVFHWRKIISVIETGPQK
jgi:hypothetical protein